MDPFDDRTEDEKQLWASLALQLLGKAALAKVSPALIADVRDSGNEMLRAVGLMEGAETHFTSVTASTVFDRCAAAFRPFSSQEAKKFSNGRNAYLHGAGIGFGAIPSSAWWSRYWSLGATLVTAQDQHLDELVGEDRVNTVEELLDQNSRNMQDRYEALINSAKQHLSQFQAGRMTAHQQAEWGARDLTAEMEHSTIAACPACDATGMLEGDHIIREDELWVQVDTAEGSWSVPQGLIRVIGPEYFSCPTCHLVLDRYELLEQAGLADVEIEEEVNDADYDYEPDYGND